MNFELLKENYTKVSYRPVNKVVVEEVKQEKKINTKQIIFDATMFGGLVIFNFPEFVFANDGLDTVARKFYFDNFIGIAKWIIVGKGGWDIVSRTMKEDFDGAKRGILQYMLIFAVLMGLPWALEQVEVIFQEA